MSEFEQKCDSAQPLVAALFRAPLATHGKARKGAVALLGNVHRAIIAHVFAQGKVRGINGPARLGQPFIRTHPNLAISRTPTLQSAALKPCNQPHPNLAISRTPTLQSAALKPCNQPPPSSPFISTCDKTTGRRNALAVVTQ